MLMPSIFGENLFDEFFGDWDREMRRMDRQLYFFLNFMQFFHEEDYFRMFTRQLRQNNIDYDVLDVTEARYPRVVLPL